MLEWADLGRCTQGSGHHRVPPAVRVSISWLCAVLLRILPNALVQAAGSWARAAVVTHTQIA